MTYQVPSFDELLFEILTDYKNLNGGTTVDTLIAKLRAYEAQYGSVPDISIETLIRSACQASALWGAYKYQEYIGKQAFPDTADSENLNHHGAVQNVPMLAGESEASYLARILDDIQNPSAGGNKYDYKKWAEEISGVAKAHVYPLAQGDGTVDVVVVANKTLTGSEIPSMSARKGTATTVATGKLIDATANFTGGTPVAAGKIVRNTFQETEALVISVDSASQLTLDADIFKFVGEHYHVHMHAGANTTATANKLIDSAAAFNDAAYPAQKGDVAKNLTDNTEAKVVSVDAAGQLTLDADIFTGIGKSYVVESLQARVKEHIDAERPLTSSKCAVLPPTILIKNVTIGTSGSNVDKTKIKDDITTLMNGYIPLQTLYPEQLTALAIARGSESSSASDPAAPVVPVAYQMIRPGVITVT